MNVEEACAAAFDNAARIKTAKNVGCYFCLRVYPAKHVNKFTDKGKTALCDNCGVDSLLADVTDMRFLTECHERWFCSPTESAN